MNLQGKAITHKDFGKGIITDVTNQMVTVVFAEDEKKFLYPDAFLHFLTLKDKNTQQKIEDICTVKERAHQAKIQAIQEEQERLHRIRNFKVTPNSHAVFGCVVNQPQEIFCSGTASTGCYLSGYSKGEPKIPTRLKPNSACLITCCPNGVETDRRIVGAFMVKDDFFGDCCRDGIVVSHEKYKMLLQPQESLLFWDYVEEADRLQKWGNTEFKYVSNVFIQKILFDIKNTTQEEKEDAEEFYRYFCKMNHLSTLPEGDRIKKEA